MIDLGIVADINNILIYTQAKEQYKKPIKDIPSPYQSRNLAKLIDKCKFHKSKIVSVSYMISDTGVKMVQNKVGTILE
jgi:hypothetical protein